MGADAILVGQHVTGWSIDSNACGNLLSSRFAGRGQPALSRPVDRLDPADHTGWAGAGVWISLDRSSVLFSRYRSRCGS